MMKMNNLEIRKVMFEENMKQWELAELLGITEWTLSRKFRKELPEEEQARIISVIRNRKGGASHDQD